MAAPIDDSWFITPLGPLSEEDCTERRATALEAYLTRLTTEHRPDQLVVACRLADHLSKIPVGFTALTYAFRPWAPAHRCRMLAAVARVLVELGEPARAEGILRNRAAWGFDTPAWQDVDWVIMGIRYWLGAYRMLPDAATIPPLEFVKDQRWWAGHLRTLTQEQGHPGYPS